jgi:hypothetical protein
MGADRTGRGLQGQRKSDGHDESGDQRGKQQDTIPFAHELLSLLADPALPLRPILAADPE